MSNRTDWEALLSEIDGVPPGARARLLTELQNAFVAGQEAEEHRGPMSDPTIERPLTIGDLLDDASLWPNTATIIRVERCLDNGRLLVREQVRDTPIGHAPRIVGPTLQRFVATVTVERLRRIPQLGPKAIRALAEAMASKGYRLRDREEPPEEVPISRDALLARVADIVRKSRVADAETLVWALERKIGPDLGDLSGAYRFAEEEIFRAFGIDPNMLSPGGIVDGPPAEDEIRLEFGPGPREVLCTARHRGGGLCNLPLGHGGEHSAWMGPGSPPYRWP